VKDVWSDNIAWDRKRTKTLSTQSQEIWSFYV